MATKPESRLQRKIQQAIADEFGGWFKKIHGNQFQGAGIPDLIGTINGLFIAIEVKIPGKERTITPIQAATIKKIKEAGGIAFVTTSVDETLEKLHSELHDG